MESTSSPRTGQEYHISGGEYEGEAQGEEEEAGPCRPDPKSAQVAHGEGEEDDRRLVYDAGFGLLPKGVAKRWSALVSSVYSLVTRTASMPSPRPHAVVRVTFSHPAGDLSSTGGVDQSGATEAAQAGASEGQEEDHGGAVATSSKRRRRRKKRSASQPAIAVSLGANAVPVQERARRHSVGGEDAEAEEAEAGASGEDDPPLQRTQSVPIAMLRSALCPSSMARVSPGGSYRSSSSSSSAARRSRGVSFGVVRAREYRRELNGSGGVPRAGAWPLGLSWDVVADDEVLGHVEEVERARALARAEAAAAAMTSPASAGLGSPSTSPVLRGASGKQQQQGRPRRGKGGGAGRGGAPPPLPLPLPQQLPPLELPAPSVPAASSVGGSTSAAAEAGPGKKRRSRKGSSSGRGVPDSPGSPAAAASPSVDETNPDMSPEVQAASVEKILPLTERERREILEEAVSSSSSSARAVTPPGSIASATSQEHPPGRAQKQRGAGKGRTDESAEDVVCGHVADVERANVEIARELERLRLYREESRNDTLEEEELREELVRLSVAQLKSMLREVSLKATGSKPQLVARLAKAQVKERRRAEQAQVQAGTRHRTVEG